MQSYLVARMLGNWFLTIVSLICCVFIVNNFFVSADNNLAGTLPGETRIIQNLESIDIGGNSLMGPIPTFLPELLSLRAYRSSDNSLSGPIPTFIGMVGSLEEFEVRTDAFRWISWQVFPQFAQLISSTSK